jgi:nicotinamidase-related amidase
MDKFTLVQKESALIVIDIQERLVPAMPNSQKVIQNTNTLLSVANKLEIPTIITEQYPKGLGDTVQELRARLENVKRFEKITFSSYTEELREELNAIGRKKVIITGMETHICVLQTARDLISNGYQVFIVSDGVCSRAKENHLNGLSLMESMGAVITNTETVIFDLLKKAGTPEFKVLSKLIK